MVVPGRACCAALAVAALAAVQGAFATDADAAAGAPAAFEQLYSVTKAALGERICSGHDTQWGECPDMPSCIACTPIDCELSDWGQWYPGPGCTGLRFRHRTVKASNNKCGKPCEGAQIESGNFTKAECQVKPKDCLFSNWASWSECASAMDQAVRSREVMQPPSEHGKPCEGGLKETRPCGGPKMQPCVFSDWREWTTCSTSCGEGRHTRMRHIATEAAHGGRACDDAVLETRKCMATPCPIQNCELSEWSQWSTCDGSHAQKIRRRSINQSPLGEGLPCDKNLMETAGCDGPEPVDCELSSWTQWTDCDKSCHGGQQYRERELRTPSRDNGKCALLDLKMTQPCNTFSCSKEEDLETADCRLTIWSEWSGCSTTYGKGSRTRERMVDTLATNKGHGCEGPLVDVEPCSTSMEDVSIGCQWGSWIGWSQCTASCGGGHMRRSREVAVQPANGGTPCEPADMIEVAPCGTQACDEECTDGLWSEWMEWTSCSATCSSGYKSRRRTIDVLPSPCGKPVYGLREEFAVCDDLPPCIEDRDCELSSWGEWSHCSCECFGIRERNRQVTVFASGKGLRCSESGLKAVEPCNPGINETASIDCGNRPRVDCLMNEWEDWTRCTVSCGGGQMERKRTIKVPAVNGGTPCSDSLCATAPCNTEPCEPVFCQKCEWGPWSDWGDCSKCGGQRWRHRSIETLPNHCGTPCEAQSAKEVSNCTSHCNEPSYCTWAEWSDAHCSGQCGLSTTMRSRAMTSKKEATDFIFKGDRQSTCMGSQLKAFQCPVVKDCTPACVPRHCHFAEWSDWNEPTCVGLCERQRVIAETNNECGDPCNGPLLETKRCSVSCNVPKDCVLTDWEEWSACPSKDVGQRYRLRKISQEPMNGGEPCKGHFQETRGCNAETPDACEFDEWDSWSDCSATCGEGTKLRTRHVLKRASAGGEQCTGGLKQLQSCHSWSDGCRHRVTQDCRFGTWEEWSSCKVSGQRDRFRSIGKEASGGGMPCLGDLHETETCQGSAVDCEMSDWTRWDDCDKTCGAGQTHRYRQIHHHPQHGGKLCPHELIQTRGCNLDPCRVEDCRVSGWSEWGGCSTTCGPGMQMRHREVASLRGPGGAGCFFSLGETRACAGGDLPSCGARECEWDVWSEWTECTASCNGGIRKRSRDVLRLPGPGGSPCQAQPKEEVEPCNMDGCRAGCKDGEWGLWQSWSPCSVSCDGGTSFRKRQIVKMANSCGREPEGKERETRFCNVDKPCEQSRDCVFNFWSAWSACSASCSGVKKRSRSVKNFGRGSGAWCVGALQETWPCNPGTNELAPSGCDTNPVVDCLLGEWQEWSPCSSTCGGGQHMRSRDIAQHPANGGKGCGDPLSEITECARKPCLSETPIDCAFGDWHDWAECSRCNGERKRTREIIAYPQHGGRPCEAFVSEDVGRCPRTCDEQLYCSWETWSSWSDCTATCGTGGKRHRRRDLSLSDVPPPEPTMDANVLQKYEVLARRTEALEAGQAQELLVAFSAGGLSLLAAFVGFRAVASARGPAGASGTAAARPVPGTTAGTSSGYSVEAAPYHGLRETELPLVAESLRPQQPHRQW